jgi:hypothetical protein
MRDQKYVYVQLTLGTALTLDLHALDMYPVHVRLPA